jgi:phage shock protein PspC (stress-responsive transcriptional regulator)
LYEITVTTINLAGSAFQIEDPGFAALRKYLDDAKAALAGNPDADEIMADMERAIADKCRACLSDHKNVVSAEEATKIVAEMGPIGGAEHAEGAANTAGTPKPKRLFRIAEGAVLGGVANGFAAYFDVDVILIRVLLIALVILTGGGFILAYFIAWLVIPPAVTGAQRAQAYGAPFNAQEIIDRVKTEYANIEARMPEWKSQWRHHRHEMKRQQQAMRAEHRAWKRQKWHHGPSAVGQLLQIIVVAFLLWLGYNHVAVIHDFMDAAWRLFTHTVDAITQAIEGN